MNDFTKKRGFTIIELLIVLAIIGILTVIVLPRFNSAREKANEAKARADVRSLAQVALPQLADDTGKWPNGCPTDALGNPEVRLDAQQAGIVEAPVVGNQGGGCEWTAEDIAHWNGPYFRGDTLVDGWGNPYYFDPDYHIYQNCATQAPGPTLSVVLSFGPNGSGLNAYDCDDIFTKLNW